MMTHRFAAAALAASLFAPLFAMPSLAQDHAAVVGDGCHAAEAARARGVAAGDLEGEGLAGDLLAFKQICFYPDFPFCCCTLIVSIIPYSNMQYYAIMY